jgi:CRISPR-associated protein Csm5
MKNTTHFFLLTVHSPLHLGCGEVYEPTGFVVDENLNQLVAFQPERFLAALAENDRKDFSNICRKGTVESLTEVYRFIHDRKEMISGAGVDVSPNFTGHYLDTIALRGNRVGSELNKFQIERTAFRSLDQRPYVPGSAIKGAMRTAVLNELRSGRAGGRDAASLERSILGGSFDQDPFRLIKPGDFVPVGTCPRAVRYAVNKKKKPTEKQARGPAQIMEVVEPGALFFGPVTIQDGGGTGIRKPITLQTLTRALEGFYAAEFARETAELRGINIPGGDIFPAQRKGSPIRLGRHAGAECLTIEGCRDIKIMKGRDKKAAFLDHATTLWLASNDRTGSVPSHLQPFGWATLRLLSAEEARELRGRCRQDEMALTRERDNFLDEMKQRAESARRVRLAEEAEMAKRLKAQEEQALMDKLYPWRKLFVFLDGVSDWGTLNQDVLVSEKFKAFQSEPELAARVAACAGRVAELHAGKWDAEREEKVVSWLHVSGLVWASGKFNEGGGEPVLSAEQQVILEKISTIKELGHFYTCKIDIETLDRVCAQHLLKQLRELNWQQKPKKKKSKASAEKKYAIFSQVKKYLASMD